MEFNLAIRLYLDHMVCPLCKGKKLEKQFIDEIIDFAISELIERNLIKERTKELKKAIFEYIKEENSKPEIDNWTKKDFDGGFITGEGIGERDD